VLVSSTSNNLLWSSIYKTALSWAGVVFVSSINGSDITGEGSILRPYMTIQKAHDMALSGNLIYLFPGTYAGNITFSKNNLQVSGFDNNRYSSIITGNVS